MFLILQIYFSLSTLTTIEFFLIINYTYQIPNCMGYCRKTNKGNK